jgi:hypothetical protein
LSPQKNRCAAQSDQRRSNEHRAVEEDKQADPCQPSGSQPKTCQQKGKGTARGKAKRCAKTA